MKKFLYMAVAAIAALSSCSGDDLSVNGNANNNNNVNAPVFTATIEGDATSRTRLVAGPDGKKVEWLSSDEKVFIWSVDANGTLRVAGSYDVTPESSDASSATLTAPTDITYVNSNAGDAATTLAFYPVDMTQIDRLTQQESFDEYKAVGKGADMQSLSNFYKLTLSSPQTYNGENISKIAPMAAYSQGGTNLQFKNITSMLAITVPASEFTSVQTIVVTTEKQMWGEFKFDKDNMVAVPTMSAEAMEAYKGEYGREMNKATLNCSNTAIPDGGSKTFYISIPANTYQNFKIEVTDGTTTKMMRTKVGDLFIERSKIYSMTFKADEPGNTTPNLGNDNEYQF